MHKSFPFLIAVVFLLGAIHSSLTHGVGNLSQQTADENFNATVDQPAYKKNGPKILFDEAHNNFHTASGRYKPFADLITNDGYQVTPNKQKFSADITEVGSDIVLNANEAREFLIRTNVIPVDTPDERRSPRNDVGPIVFSVHSPGSSEPISQRETKVVFANAKVLPGLRVGYVRSFDDSLGNALTALGVESRELSIEEIRTADLAQFDTIIIDNRGYQAHPELLGINKRLLEFAFNGGTLIVCYHRANEWNPDPAQNRPSLAPYPILLDDERVTDENAEVTFAVPGHPLLNTPNKIGPDDFKGWIQERGLYYPKSWDSRYVALFAMHDVGEEPLRGGLLVADYGRGHYIYTSMVWYRQLRAGVPGGYRMFANMISYGKTR